MARARAPMMHSEHALAAPDVSMPATACGESVMRQGPSVTRAWQREAVSLTPRVITTSAKSCRGNCREKRLYTPSTAPLHRTRPVMSGLQCLYSYTALYSAIQRYTALYSYTAIQRSTVYNPLQHPSVAAVVLACLVEHAEDGGVVAIPAQCGLVGADGDVDVGG